MKLPIEYISDDKMRADFTAYLNAQTGEERERVISEYNRWFAALSAEEKAEVTAARVESMHRFLDGAKNNMEQLCRTVQPQRSCASVSLQKDIITS